MKLFLLFLLVLFASGVLFYKWKPQKRNWWLFLFCVAVAGAYFFLHKI